MVRVFVQEQQWEERTQFVKHYFNELHAPKYKTCDVETASLNNLQT